MSNNNIGIQGRYEASTGERNLKYFDTFQAFSDQNIGTELDRNGLAYRLCFGIPEEAMADWFVLTDFEGKNLKQNDEVQQWLTEIDYRSILVKAYGFTAGYGACGDVHFDNKVLIAPNKDCTLAQNGNREWSSVKIREYFNFPVEGSMFKEWDLSAEQLTYFQYWMFEEKNKTNFGRSYLEPIWDYLQTIDICMKLSPIIVAQVTGMKVVTGKGLSADNAEDEAFANAVRTSDKDLVLFLREGETYDIKYPPQNTFIEQTLTWALTMIASKTGYPVEYLKGNQVGTTSGASQTISQVDEGHRTIQRRATPFIIQDIKIEALKRGVTLPDFTLYWNKKAELTETEQANLLKNQVSAIQALKSIGYSDKEAFEKVGLDLPAQPLDQQQQVQPQMPTLNNTINNTNPFSKFIKTPTTMNISGK